MTKKSRRIVFVTGTRADFGKIEPLASVAQEAGLDVHFFVTGMHMMNKYGLTKTEVHRVRGANVVEFINQRDKDPQDIILAKTIVGFSDFIKEESPDLVVIHGDRIEALACALVCATNYVRCVHVEGGEVSGTIDEIFRHCNTKLANIHLVSSQIAAHRILQMGESEASVHIIGSPELDQHAQTSGVSIEEVRKYYEIPFQNYGIVIFHPVTSEASEMGTQARAMFEAIIDTHKNMVVILPNNDPGAENILEVISSLPKEQFRVLPSMRFNYFSELVKNASIFIGNSSAGVREAPFMGIPSLDIGTRQSNRANASSIGACSAFDANSIKTFISKEWGKRYSPDLSFGSGSATQKFNELLASDRFWQLPMQKYYNSNVKAKS